ncbi:hypothetical protein M0R88_10945 [Halorussus gelatinilyticus]|uniref:Uncharacterized protein n=1 Tax=Halorussus gelatinilyticus TaxID=2937524 RepID=A0A8U0IFI0_9EURY|nr:hypothetical protein [Halorussus gelatinilyticus]UPV99043.1 hypothetical protein M0R88_10945 [Halorussus gelatinilyticus]
MTLPTGLVPATVFVLTAGIALLVTGLAHLFYRAGAPAFSAALRRAILAVGGLYLVGVLVVWAFAGGLRLWEVAATLVVAGLANLAVLTALPLVVGRLIVRLAGGVDDSDAALRYATAGWPVAMLTVFVGFVLPGGLGTNSFFHLGGVEICLVGFCGVSLWTAFAVLLELAAALLGPGVVGLALYSAGVGARERTAGS